MDIFVLEGKKIREFDDLLPAIPAPRLVKVIGARVDGIPCASLVLEIMNGLYRISWLYVHPDYRRQGIGKKLLSVVCETIHKNTDKSIEITYKTGDKFTAIIDHMLLAKGFELSRHRLLTYKVSREELLQLPFCRNNPQKMKEKRTIYSLGELSPVQLKEMIAQNEKNKNYLVSRADYLNVDSSRSKVLLLNREMKGLVLLQNTEKEGIMKMPLLYLDRRYGDSKMWGMLFREAVMTAVKPPTSLQILEFHCINEASEKLAGHLFPNCKPQKEWVAYAVMR